MIMIMINPNQLMEKKNHKMKMDKKRVKVKINKIKKRKKIMKKMIIIEINSLMNFYYTFY